MKVLNDGRPFFAGGDDDTVGRGPWARLLATSVVRDESSPRAERGRILARSGHVHTVVIDVGEITGIVIGSGGSEYRVSLAAEPVSPRVWSAVIGSARGRQLFRAAAEGREQSLQLEHVMTVDWEEPLVPATRSLRRTCTCGRPVPCAHLAALAYVLADRIDREPSLLLRWRGCTEQVEPEPAEPEPIVAGEEIWEAGPPPQLGPPRPLPTAAVLKRLGKSGIQVGGQDLAEVLERAYASFAASGR